MAWTGSRLLSSDHRIRLPTSERVGASSRDDFAADITGGIVRYDGASWQPMASGTDAKSPRGLGQRR